LSKLDQFDGSSFRQVRLITIVKKIFNGPDVFFRPFAQERFKILIRPHGHPLASDHFFPGGPRLLTLPAAMKADSGPADLSPHDTLVVPEMITLHLSARAGVDSSQKAILRVIVQGRAKRVVIGMPDKDAVPPT
jgi:hypothetical protein